MDPCGTPHVIGNTADFEVGNGKPVKVLRSWDHNFKSENT